MKTTLTFRTGCWMIAAAISLAVCTTETAFARVRLESICSVQGQREQRLVGLGLVVGLKGTGDGGDYLPTIRALGAALKLMNNPIEKEMFLKETKNVAMVMIEATVPATGIRRGQTIDCHISSIGSCKSLRGGRLLAAPLQSAFVPDERALAVASGAILLEDPQYATTGKIPNGVIIESNFDDFVAMYIENGSFTLLLDSAHSSFHAASEVARVVNADISFEANSRQIARATGPGMIRVTVPEQYRTEPVDFVAQVLDIGIDNPHTQARVVLNPKAGIIVVTGEVEISPVVISHKALVVTVGDPNPVPGEDTGDHFVPLMERSPQAPQHLKDLVEALNQLKVPTTDIIEIVRDLHRSGKLHAVVINE
jgi:flagellar P-ring protein precursor FlgI